MEQKLIAIKNSFEQNGIAFVQDASMAEETSFRTGGAADLMVTANDEDELCRILKIVSEEDCPFMLLGNGTNILVRDGGYRGVMIKLGEGFRSIERRGDKLVCGAAVLLSAAARAAAEEGLGGMEFASGIPGSIGGAAFMNAGAYDGQMSDIIEEVRLISPDGKGRTSIPVADMEAGYRTSRMQRTGEIVIGLSLGLTPADPAGIKKAMADFTARRNAKQPVNLPSAGSFFKRPEGYFAGKLIQDAGLKGLSVGGAMVSELHAGFIVNTGAATATDIEQLMEIVQATVMKTSGVMLEPEVRIIGERAE